MGVSPVESSLLLGQAGHGQGRHQGGERPGEVLLVGRVGEQAGHQVGQAGDGGQPLGLRDLSRADFVVTSDGDITLLEVNTLPGLTPTSLYPKAMD